MKGRKGTQECTASREPVVSDRDAEGRRLRLCVSGRRTRKEQDTGPGVQVAAGDLCIVTVRKTGCEGKSLLTHC